MKKFIIYKTIKNFNTGNIVAYYINNIIEYDSINKILFIYNINRSLNISTNKVLKEDELQEKLDSLKKRKTTKIENFKIENFKIENNDLYKSIFSTLENILEKKESCVLYDSVQNFQTQHIKKTRLLTEDELENHNSKITFSFIDIENFSFLFFNKKNIFNHKTNIKDTLLLKDLDFFSDFYFENKTNFYKKESIYYELKHENNSFLLEVYNDENKKSILFNKEFKFIKDFKKYYLQKNTQTEKQFNEVLKNTIIECDHEKIKPILENQINKEKLIKEVISRNENNIKLENISSFEVNILSYSDFSIYIKTKDKTSSIVCGSSEEYKKTKIILGENATNSIKNIIEEEKKIIEEKVKSNYYENNPFNIISKITLDSCGKIHNPKSFLEIDEILKKDFNYNIKEEDEGNDKVYLSIELKNKENDIFNIAPRIDISKSKGDFNPLVDNILNYLINSYGYNIKTPRKSESGLANFYVDLENATFEENKTSCIKKKKKQISQNN